MNSFDKMIGKTPLVFLERFGVYAKIEKANPAGSVKDRAAKYMIDTAAKKGIISFGSTIVEPTSGNTGIALAAYAVPLGYKVILTMPDTMSEERIQLIKSYGAEVILTPGAEGMRGAINEAENFVINKSAFCPNQFANPANPQAHYETTAPEIWEAMNGEIDFFVAGVGSGGTITGIAKFLKEKNSTAQIVAVEPAESPVISGGCAGAHKIQGIGAGFIPKNLDISLLDAVVTVKYDDAVATCKRLASKEGLLCGLSSGAALFAAESVAKENPGKKIVVILPDSGERYLSLGIF